MKNNFIRFCNVKEMKQLKENHATQIVYKTLPNDGFFLKNSFIFILRETKYSYTLY